MCGIAGILSARKNKEEREFLVRKMMELMSHRGPDGEGLHHSKNVTIGHRRLAIIDLDAGSQPMLTDDGRYAITYNGELYNYIELREKLIRLGVRFKTNSDTEVLLQMLIHFGSEGIEQLNGMFAFAFLDFSTNDFILCRDRVGIKPLYYVVANEELFFASEIKALVKSKLCSAVVDEEALHEYLTYQFCLGEKTLFKGISKLEPGHFIQGKNGLLVKKVKYWDTSFAIDSHHTEEYFEEQLQSLLKDSIRLQMRSDVPVGVYLSGGIDSSAVASLAFEISGQGPQAFHGKFLEGKAYDESHYAKVMVDSIKAKYHETVPTEQDFINEFPQLIYMLDEPVAGPGSFPQLLVSRHAAKHVKVVLGGQGGDELFCGYARYLIGYLEQAIKGSIFETQEEGKYLVTLSTIIKSLPLLKQYTPLMQTFWQKGLFDDMDARYFRLIDRSPDLDTILSSDMRASYNKAKVFDSFKNVFNHPQTLSYINKMTHFDLKTLLPSLLQVEDRVSMAASLESRVPLLDHRIIDLVTSMPPAVKFNDGQTKYILKKSLQNKVPAEIIDRKDKMGFPVPLKEWSTSKAFRSFVLDIMETKKARERGIFKPGTTEKLLNQDQNFGRQLWGMLSLEMWHQTFID